MRLQSPSRFRQRPESQSVESLLEHISSLTLERQTLRSSDADTAALEQNRVQIARAQWLLSYALIERYLPAAAAQNAA